MSDTTTLSVVIPVYRSAPILPRLIEQLAADLPSLADEFEVVLVNDGSPDESWEVIQQLASQHAWVRGIAMMRNYGQHNALLCGIRAANYPIVVTMDDDLQHPPTEIRKILEPLVADECDVVYGPPHDEQHGLFRDLASQITKWVLRGAMGAETARNVSAFRAFRTSIREAFANVQGPYVNIDVLLTWGATRFRTVRVRHDPRAEGESTYTFRKLLTHAMNMMTGFSTLPLQVASYIGFGLTLFGLVILGYVVIRWAIQGSVVPGFPFLASLIAIFSGAQLFTLGIMGEYLARMHFRMMDRPPYVVARSTGPAPEELANAERLELIVASQEDAHD